MIVNLRAIIDQFIIKWFKLKLIHYDANNLKYLNPILREKCRFNEYDGYWWNTMYV